MKKSRFGDVVGEQNGALLTHREFIGNYEVETFVRKMFLFMMISLDGYYEGPNGDISWHNAANNEFNEFAVQQTSEADILLFGRKTYELMESYWPTEAAKRDDPIVAGLMNSLPKIVVSKTLDSVEWENTRLIKENVSEEISKLKGQPGKDIAILGSSELTVALTNMGLVDEYRIMVNPVALGDGKSLFKGLADNLNLKLITSRAFRSGNVLLYYRPDYKTNTKNDISPSQRITENIAELSDWRGEMLARMRKLVLEAAPDLTEEWKWDTPVWSKKGNVVAIGAFKDHIKLNFFKGASLDDPNGLFNAGLEAKATRGIDFNEGDEIDEAALKELIRAAVAYNLSSGKKK